MDPVTQAVTRREPKPGLLDRVRARVWRLEDEHGEPGSMQLVFVRRSMLLYTVGLLPMSLIVLFGTVGFVVSPEVRRNLLQHPFEVLVFLVAGTLPIPVFLGLRKRKRVALVTLLVIAVGAAVALGWNGMWTESVVAVVLSFLVASCWQDVNQ